MTGQVEFGLNERRDIDRPNTSVDQLRVTWPSAVHCSVYIIFGVDFGCCNWLCFNSVIPSWNFDYENSITYLTLFYLTISYSNSCVVVNVKCIRLIKRYVTHPNGRGRRLKCLVSICRNTWTLNSDTFLNFDEVTLCVAFYSELLWLCLACCLIWSNRWVWKRHI